MRNGNVGWNAIDALPRTSTSSVRSAEIPESAGVYAFYRDSTAVYVGKAKSLQQRVWRNHLSRGQSMTGSALRRNVMEHLGIATAADIKARRYRPSTIEVEQVTAWIGSCAVVWIACESEAEALRLEARLKRERRPLLTKI